MTLKSFKDITQDGIEGYDLYAEFKTIYYALSEVVSVFIPIVYHNFITDTFWI